MPLRGRDALDLPPWAAEIAAQTVDRALPPCWPAAFAERFEAGWRKTLKNDVPPSWPTSFRERLLGQVYRDFLGRLRAEDVRGPLLDRLLAELAVEITPHMTRAQVKKIAIAWVSRLIEAWIEPLLDEAVMEAAARIQDEIQGARSMIRRIQRLRPKELHRFAAQYNWDDGYLYLFEVIRSPNCALATAVMLYRLGRPHCFLQYSSRRDVPSYCIDNYDLLIEIEEGIRRGTFQDHAVRYEPKPAVSDQAAASMPPARHRSVPPPSRVGEIGAGRAAAPLHSARQVKTTAAARRALSGPTRAAR